MDSLDVQSLKIEKANAILRYRRRQRITTLFRFIELCVVLIIISRFSSQLPIAFKLSGEYFRGLSFTLVSPRFVFVVGNAIIIILFLKSGQFSAQDNTSSNSSFNLYDEYVDNHREKNRDIHGDEIKEQTPKQSMCEESTIIADPYTSKQKKNIHRSRSETFKNVHSEEPRRELRRSVTERCRKSMDSAEKPVVTSYAEDDMSSEEFRRTVEAFIARQQRFLREEEFPTIVSSPGSGP